MTYIDRLNNTLCNYIINYFCNEDLYVNVYKIIH